AEILAWLEAQPLVRRLRKLRCHECGWTPRLLDLLGQSEMWREDSGEVLPLALMGPVHRARAPPPPPDPAPGPLPDSPVQAPDAPKTVARQFNRIAWPAFAVLFVTGLWNLSETHVGDRSSAWIATLFAKLAIVALSGISAALHTRAATRQALALWGALSGLSALLALFYGIQLNGHG